MVEICAAHNIPYVASTSIAYPLDLFEKVQKAAAIRGPSYIHCHSPCPTGWGIDTKDTIKVARLAVQTGAIILYEIENGVRKLSKKRGRNKPIELYLEHQKRFRHILGNTETLAQIQAGVDQRYEAVLAAMSPK